jgi:drug/metabolite transporter (DMT)-like permease
MTDRTLEERAAAVPQGVYKLGLALTTIIWGSSFVVLKNTLDDIPPGWLLFVRFGLAALVLTAFLHRRVAGHLDRTHVLASLLIGLSGGAAYLVQNIGLVSTTPAKNAFLTASYCVMVPFLHWATTRKRPGAHNVVAALLCVAGIYLVTGGSIGGIGAGGTGAGAGGESAGLAALLNLGIGDALTLLAALLFGIQIELIDRYAARCDALTISTLELWVYAAVCGISAIAGGESLPDASVLSPQLLLKLLYLVLLATVFSTLAQNVGQKYVEPSQAALLMSLESVFGVLFSITLYHEQVTPGMLVGFVAIFVSVLVSELAGSYNRKNVTRGEETP